MEDVGLPYPGRAATGAGRYLVPGEVPGETPWFVGNMAGERPSPPIRAERLSASCRSRAIRSWVEIRASCCESVEPESDESDE